VGIYASGMVVKVGISAGGPSGSVIVVMTLGGVVVGMYWLGAAPGGLSASVVGMYADVLALSNDLGGSDSRER
jgi:hypothetical protein